MQDDVHTYALVLDEDDKGAAARIEFEARDPAQAIRLAGQLSPNQEIEVLEDDKALGTIKLAKEGFWKLSPTR